MTNEKAIKHLEVIKGDCALVGDIRALDMAISALSADGEYIKKADMEKILYSTNNTVRIGELFTELPTYAIPETTPSGEYIKKADALRIASITTLSVDQVVSTIKALPTYSFPDSADDNTMEWIPAKVGKLFPSNDYKCSKCGNILNFDGVNCGRGDANFCPNCGRKAVKI